MIILNLFIESLKHTLWIERGNNAVHFGIFNELRIVLIKKKRIIDFFLKKTHFFSKYWFFLKIKMTICRSSSNWTVSLHSLPQRARFHSIWFFCRSSRSSFRPTRPCLLRLQPSRTRGNHHPSELRETTSQGNTPNRFLRQSAHHSHQIVSYR